LWCMKEGGGGCYGSQKLTYETWSLFDKAKIKLLKDCICKNAEIFPLVTKINLFGVCLILFGKMKLIAKSVRSYN